MDFKGVFYCIVLIAALYFGFDYLHISTDVFASLDTVDRMGVQAGTAGSLSILNGMMSDLAFFITSLGSQLINFVKERVAEANFLLDSLNGFGTSKTRIVVFLVPFFPFLLAVAKPYEI